MYLVTFHGWILRQPSYLVVLFESSWQVNKIKNILYAY